MSNTGISGILGEAQEGAAAELRELNVRSYTANNQICAFPMTQWPHQLKFPDPLDCKPVSIVPVYIEPLIRSGERLFCGLVVHSAEGTGAHLLPDLVRLKTVYGDKYRGLMTSSQLALDSLSQYLERKGIAKVSEWETPCEGIYLGPVLHTTTNTIAEAVRVSFSEWSSLYSDLSNSTQPSSTSAQALRS